MNRNNILQKRISGLFGIFIVLAVLSTTASALPYAKGDVFAGTGSGKIDVYSDMGVFKQTLDTTSGSAEETGMCFDKDGNLYTTDWTAGNMAKFDKNGVLLVFPWAGPFSVHPETCVVNKANDAVYVGEVDGANKIRKFSLDGTTLIASFSPAGQSRGTDWMDLAADQKTIYYTSEGNLIKRFDVSGAGAQLTDFATAPTSPCYALRIRSNGDVMVACSSELVRFDSSGTVVQTYPASSLITPTGGSGEPSFLFAMNLDPNGTAVWTGGYSTGNIYKIDIASGAELRTFNAPPRVFSMAGLAIFGEHTVGGPNPNPVPEFPSVVLPVAGIMGIVVLLFRRRED